jgi:hypothetical protein
MNPTNPLTLVRRLAANQASCTLFGVVVTELRKHGLDSEDLLEIIKSDLGETHCFDSKETEKYYPSSLGLLFYLGGRMQVPHVPQITCCYRRQRRAFGGHLLQKGRPS